MPTGLATLAMTSLLAMSADGNPPALFEDPVRLTAGDDAFKEVLYPTPVLHDIDRDGTRELVVGDLFGYLTVSEPGESEIAWAKAEKIQRDGKPLKLNNW